MEKMNRSIRDKDAEIVDNKTKFNETLKKMKDQERQYRQLDDDLRETRKVLEQVREKVNEAEKHIQEQEIEHSKENTNLVRIKLTLLQRITHYFMVKYFNINILNPSEDYYKHR